MPKLPWVRYIAPALLAASAAGCATHADRWFDYDQSRDRRLLVVGDFSSIWWLDAIPPCLDGAPGGTSENEMVIDCDYAPAAITTLNVEEVVYGDYPGQRLQVLQREWPFREPGPPGNGKPMLVLLQTDGKNYAIYRLQLLARTTQGEWALPVEGEELLDILPCGAGPLVKPLRFAHPLPGSRQGIPLSDIKKFIAAKPPRTPAEYECPYYGTSSEKFTIEGLD
jgi:hypothetical protein